MTAWTHVDVSARTLEAAARPWMRLTALLAMEADRWLAWRPTAEARAVLGLDPGPDR